MGSSVSSCRTCVSQPLTQSPQRPSLEENHFSTARWVAAMRATDAKSQRPRIGSNIGAGPDLAAAVFAGELGTAFLADSAAAFHIPIEVLSESLVRRTMYFDEQWMAAYDRGCRQFVILAAGVDARAWRLPMDTSCIVFEVDVPAAFAYKDEHLPALSSTYPLPACKRVAVAADLAEDDWKSKLAGVGYDVSKPSFFLVEGLLMYLPSADAVQSVFEDAASLMCPGSVFAGDCLVSYLHRTVYRMIRPVLEKYGTAWSFDVNCPDDLVVMLRSSSISISSGPHDLSSNAKRCECLKTIGLNCCNFRYVVCSATRV